MRALAVPLSLALAASAPSSAVAQAAQRAQNTAPAQATPPAQPAPAAARPVLGLDEAVRTALANHPLLRQFRASRDAAEARSEQSRAPLLPQVTGDAFYNWATRNVRGVPVRTPSPSDPNPTDTSWSASRTASAGLTLRQVLFDAAQVQRYRSSLAATASAEATERANALQVAAGARAAFFAARAARDLVGVSRETLANEEAHLKQVQAFVEVGTRPEIDLAQVRATRANAMVALIQAENGYDTARAQLLQAMGVVGGTDFEVGDDVLPAIRGEDDAIDPLFAEAVASRPELASFREQERAQTLARSAARAGYLPTLGAQTGIDITGPTLTDTVPNWNATVTLTWNLFQGGLTRGQVREADATLDLITAQEEQFRQEIRLEVEQARLGVRAARATLSAAGEAEAAARERLRLAEGRYRAGAGSIIELGDAQVFLAAAAAQRVRSQFDLAASRALLLRALGRANP